MPGQFRAFNSQKWVQGRKHKFANVSGDLFTAVYLRYLNENWVSCPFFFFPSHFCLDFSFQKLFETVLLLANTMNFIALATGFLSLLVSRTTFSATWRHFAH